MTARKGSIVFFSVIGLVVLYAFIVLINPDLYRDWVQYWWVILIPFALAKGLFPNSKLTNWMETRVKLFKNVWIRK